MGWGKVYFTSLRFGSYMTRKNAQNGRGRMPAVTKGWVDLWL